MLDWIFATLRAHPEIALFLTLGLGFTFGRISIGSFSLGVVTSTLLAGVLVGQIGIQISPHVKSTFFLMFLFAVGYAVGPQFFRGLKGDGLKLAGLAVLVCALILVTTVVLGKLMGYGVGATAGLLSGASTISAALGVAGDSIGQLALTAPEKQAQLDVMPVAYAISYLFGTAGSAWILANWGPRLLGVDLAEECRQYETQIGGVAREASLSAYRELTVRAIRIAPGWSGKTVRDLESRFGTRMFVERVRRGAEVIETMPDFVLQAGDVVALSGRLSELLAKLGDVGVEVDDRGLLDAPIELLDVVVTNRELAGKTLADLAHDLQQAGRGVFLRKLVRGDTQLPIAPHVQIERGDTLTIVGHKSAIERTAAILGYADRETEQANMVITGFGIAIGALIGAITIEAGGLPLSLSTSGGALLAGLICGWLRAVNRRFGRIPKPALWVFNNIGLNAFIAVVGISAGPGFVTGLMNDGITLFLSGLTITIVPLVLGLLAGKYLFRMPAPMTLGAVAGARTTTAALSSIAAAANSDVCALSYSVPYAIGVMLLTTWGMVVVMLMA